MQFEPSSTEQAVRDGAAEVVRRDTGSLGDTLADALSTRVARAFLGNDGERSSTGYVLALIDVAERDLALALAVHAQLVFCDALLEGGPAVPGAAESIRGEKFGCVGFGRIQTTDESGTWTLNGETKLVTNAGSADSILVLPDMLPNATNPNAPSACLVDANDADVVRDAEDLPAPLRDLDRARVRLRGAVARHVWTERRVRERFWSGARLGNAAVALGLWKNVLGAALRAANTAARSTKPHIFRQSAHFALSDMATELDAALLVTLQAAARRDEGAGYGTLAAQAKWLAGSGCTRAAQNLAQIVGPAEAPAEVGPWLAAAQYLDTLTTTSFSDLDRIARGTLEEPRS